MVPSMDLDLSGVDAKIERAYEHLQALHAEIERWASTYPYGLRGETHDEGREHIGFLELYRRPDDRRLGLLIGDCAHNFRSALDHLTFAVAANGLNAKGLAPKELEKAQGWIAFPICSSPGSWRAALNGGKLEGAGSRVIAEIKRRQPYHAADPTTHDLSILHWLDNWDKHRVLHTFAAFPQIEALNFIPELPGPSQGQIFPTPGPYEDGAKVYHLRTSDPCPDVQVNCELLVQIRIRESPVEEEVRETLPKIGAAVQRIIAAVAEAYREELLQTTHK
jgi:hypothetical protein